MSKASKDQIEEYIAEDINPGLAMHGGYLAVADYDQESGVLQVTMGGGCHGCASSKVTLRLMITEALKEEFPSLTLIEDVTDHSGGQNPYYRDSE